MEAYCDHCATTPLDPRVEQARWVGERVAALVRRRTASRD